MFTYPCLCVEDDVDVIMRRGVYLLLAIGFGIVILVVMGRSISQAENFLEPSFSEVVQAQGMDISGTDVYTVYMPSVMQYWSSRAPSFGIQHYGALTASRGLTYTAEAGTRWIRVPLSWKQIEPTNTTPDNYDWSALDNSIINAGKYDIELVLTMAGQPEWAAEYPMGPVYDVADLEEFIGALVERYDGSTSGIPEVRYFELYNEPDNTDIGHAEHGGWGYWGNNGAGYADLLKRLYPVVHSAHSKARLVFGGMAMDWFVKDGGLFDSYFLEDVLAACTGADCFDVMNFHYYPVFYDVWEEYGVGIIGKTNYIRQQLAAYGFEDTPIICTETGWESASSWGSPELQNRYAVKVYVRGMAADLQTIVWFMLHDAGMSGGPGLLDANYQPKDSYYSYQTMTEMLQHAFYQRPLTEEETGSEQIEGYIFQVPSGRMDVVWTVDDTRYDAEDDPWLLYAASAQALRVVDKFGNENVYADDYDGQTDGYVTLPVGGSPLFLIYNP